MCCSLIITTLTGKKLDFVKKNNDIEVTITPRVKLNHIKKLLVRQGGLLTFSN